MESLDQDNLNPSGTPDQGQEVKKDFRGLLGSSRKFLSELLNIRQNTDQEATREAIIADIPFKGHTAWILVCSIFIASVGLNANSTAVVIGAMLISPLMGPILGLGMSLAINDIDHTKTKAKSPQTNGICERFHKTMLNEFYQVTFRKKIYRDIETLQPDLDNWLEYYNNERTHQ